MQVDVAQASVGQAEASRADAEIDRVAAIGQARQEAVTRIARCSS
ncbi:MAG: hypothetical protein ABSB76_40000 [Streptosporangiaceae bacterium]|jgi:hypothetical protein